MDRCMAQAKENRAGVSPRKYLGIWPSIVKTCSRIISVCGSISSSAIDFRCRVESSACKFHVLYWLQSVLCQTIRRPSMPICPICDDTGLQNSDSAHPEFCYCSTGKQARRQWETSHAGGQRKGQPKPASFIDISHLEEVNAS